MRSKSQEGLISFRDEKANERRRDESFFMESIDKDRNIDSKRSQIDNIFNIDLRNENRDKISKANTKNAKKDKIKNNNYNVIDENFSVHSYTINTNRLFVNSPKTNLINKTPSQSTRLNLNNNIENNNNKAANANIQNDLHLNIKSMNNLTNLLKGSSFKIEGDKASNKTKQDGYMVNFIVNVQNININNNNINTIENKTYTEFNILNTEQALLPKNETKKNFFFRKKTKIIITAKQRFRIVYLKLQFVLLFKYILRYVKFVGVGMLGVDIKKEMEHIDKLGLKEKFIPNTKAPMNTEACYILNPKSKIIETWSFITLFLLIYTSTILPYNVCFGDTAENFSVQWWVELMFDLLFIIDVALNFLTGYYDEFNDRLVMNPKEIALRYIQGWFLIDFISSFPFNYITPEHSDNRTNQQINKLIRLTKLPRLQKIIKLFRFLRFLKFLKKNVLVAYVSRLIKINNGIKRILMAVFLMILACHLFACIYHFSAKFVDYDEDTWVYRFNLIDEPDSMKYLTAFYFCIISWTTVGFGDYAPYNMTEKIISLFIFLLSMCFYAFSIANLSLVISDMHTETVNLHLRLKTLNDFSKKVKIKNDTYIRITQIFEKDQHHHISYNLDKFFQEIPHHTKVELLFYLNENIISNVKFFQDKTPPFVADIVEKWKRINFQKKTYIYFEGEIPYDVYFVKQGKVVYWDNEGNELFKYKNGSLMGEMEPFLNVN